MQISLNEIAHLTEGQIISGSADQSYSGLATLKDATQEDISFIGNSRYQAAFEKSSAGAILVPSDGITNPPPNAALIQVENPTLAFSAVIEALHKKVNPPFTPGIHPSASIAESAQITSEEVQIGPNVIIEDHVSIGKGSRIDAGTVIQHSTQLGRNCHLHANVTIREHSQIGNYVSIQPGAVIGADGYGYELDQGRHVKIPQVGSVRIEDHVEIGANTTIDRARFGETLIGEGTKIDNLIQIGHNVEIGKHCLIIAQSGVAGSTQIGNYVVIAAQTGISGHLKIDDQVVIGARSGVTKNLKGGATYWGKPAKPIFQEQRNLAILNKMPSLIPELKKLKKQLEQQLENQSSDEWLQIAIWILISKGNKNARHCV